MKEEIVSALKEYLKNTPKDILKKEWEEIEALGCGGPTVEEYFESMAGNPTIINNLMQENETLRSRVKELEEAHLQCEYSDMYWISQFQKVLDYWYKKETPNMDKSEFLLKTINKAPKSKLPPTK